MKSRATWDTMTGGGMLGPASRTSMGARGNDGGGRASAKRNRRPGGNVGKVPGRFRCARFVLASTAALWGVFVWSQRAPLTPPQLAEEAVLFTPPGFDRAGEPRWGGLAAPESALRAGQVEIIVRDAVTGEPIPCRVNVVGPDGNFYQPTQNPLSRFALTGVYSGSGGAWGNRLGKAPYRYVGRFFYVGTEGATVSVPEGAVRVEVWKGFEYRPETVSLHVAPGQTRRVEVKLTRSAPMAQQGYYAGDTHLHFARKTEEDDRVIFDLLKAEGLPYGFTLAPNRPPGLYTGLMDTMAVPQRRGLGRASIRSRGSSHLMSGQEYRTTTYGHLKVLLRDELLFPGQSFDGDQWPVYGEIGREIIAQGGFAVQAHGGYGQEIYADAALGTISGVELLQFGEYRGIGLEDWYHMLNTGYRFAAEGSSDYPACRTLADCRTYVYHATAPNMPEWLAGQAAGRSFFTTGPLLLLEVDGEKPGSQIRRQGTGPQQVRARVRVRCEVTPVTDIDLIVSGRVVKHLAVLRPDGQGRWLELEQTVDLTESGWIAARAYSKSPGGFPDAEAHTNPVYVYLNDRAPFQKAAVDAWIAKIDGQIAIHAQRLFPENAKVLNYFQQARDVLLKIRAAGGMTAEADPKKFVPELVAGEPGKRNLMIDGSATDITDEEMKSFLQAGAVPPKSPAEALGTFETVGGFRMELVAAEPLIRSPIVASFDEDGNLYVGEMTDYPFNPYVRAKLSWQRSLGGKPVGSVRLLRDTDGDGVYDRATVFADELLWVGGIVPWKGGVYVTAPPDIWYLKDTDGDGKADVRQKVFSGFGLEGQQGFVNGLQFGLDHRIYAATSYNGGDILPGNDPAAAPVSVNGRDLSFTPEMHRLELETGTRQFGVAFDDWGNRFLCDQGNPCFHVVLPLRYLERSPQFTPRATIFNTAVPRIRLFRISPVERWRHIKSSRRFAGSDLPADISPLSARGQGRRQSNLGRPASSGGINHHAVDATAGVTVYRGGAYPPEYYGNVFVGDSVANLVHRRKLVPEGATFRTERVDANTEFVRTSDNWFHPVNFVNAPDGTLYCIDMAREYSETVNIPADVEKQMDLTSGKDRGRIYRIAPPGFRPPPPPRLSRASTAELVRLLESSHGWWRDTAHRLLYERQDRSAIPALEQLVQRSASPQARVNALWSLHGLQALSNEAIVRGLTDRHPGVRKNAVRLADARLDASSEIREKIAAMIGDPGPRVRLQVAFTIGESRQWNQVALLADMARENLQDPWIQSAVISSAAECGGGLMTALTSDERVLADAQGREFLRQLATVIGFQNRPADVTRMLEALAAIPEPAAALPLVSALGEGLKRAGTNLTAADRAGKTAVLLRQARSIAIDPDRPEPVRRAAIEALALIPYQEAAPTLAALLVPTQALEQQRAVIHVLRQFEETQIGPLLLKRYPHLATAAQTLAIDVLLERADRIALLLDAVRQQIVPRGDLSATQVATLRRHGEEWVRDRTADVLGAANPAKRQDVFRAYRPALDLPGLASRGKMIFESRCLACHQVAGIGFAFGPDLTSVGAGGKEKLLSSILDPNRDVESQYFLYSIETKNGESAGGVLKHETATAVTLLQVGGVEKTIARANISQMQTTRQSVMPDGLEGGLNNQDMADLIEFLVNP